MRARQQACNDCGTTVVVTRAEQRRAQRDGSEVLCFACKIVRENDENDAWEFTCGACRGQIPFIEAMSQLGAAKRSGDHTIVIDDLRCKTCRGAAPPAVA